jgi:hypothetical protein
VRAKRGLGPLAVLLRFANAGGGVEGFRHSADWETREETTMTFCLFSCKLTSFTTKLQLHVAIERRPGPRQEFRR